MPVNIVLAKWLALGPKVLIVDEPTRGIDVGAIPPHERLDDPLDCRCWTLQSGVVRTASCGAMNNLPFSLTSHVDRVQSTRSYNRSP
jgi:hypothetical protein